MVFVIVGDIYLKAPESAPNLFKLVPCLLGDQSKQRSVAIETDSHYIIQVVSMINVKETRQIVFFFLDNSQERGGGGRPTSKSCLGNIH